MTSHDGPMRIAVAGDELYARHIGAMLCSLFENQSGRYRLEILLLGRNVSAHSCGHLAAICARYGVPLTICPIAPDRFADAPVPAHYSPVNYYRLLLPEVVDSAIDRILYLDGDMIVLGPLDEAWETDVADVAVGAVRDGKRFPDDTPDEVVIESAPFNSGFLLFNLTYWRRHRVLDRLLEFIRRRGSEGVMRYVDQDALNAVLAHEWRPLPLKFNVQPSVFVPNRRTAFTEEERAVSREQPVVLHYCGPRKPWHYRSTHPKSGIYWRYARLTPWNGLGYADFSVREWANRLLSEQAPSGMYRLLQQTYRWVNRRPS